MRGRISIIGWHFLFWIAFLAVARCIFLLYNFTQAQTLSAGDVALVFWNGLKMDASIAGYVTMFIGLILTLSVFIRGRWAAWSVIAFDFIFLLFACIVIVIDVELYKHWGFRLNTTPLFYMGSEAVGSADPLIVVLLLVLLVILFVVSWYAFRRIVGTRLHALQPATSKKAALVVFLLTAFMFLPIRGSLSVAPMSISFVYFHKTNLFANHAGINVLWNFLYSLKSDANIIYPEDYFDKSLTEKYFHQLMDGTAGDSTLHVLNTTRPNVILIITESYTANVIESLGGMKGIAPNLTQLSSEGVLFDNIYSSADRTDKGLVSVLSGYPAPPRRSVIMYENKVQKLPQLSLSLEKLGYATSFVYGGDADFANFRSYLSHGKFAHVTTVDDFPDSLNTSKWGVHDQYVFDQAIREMDTSAHAPVFKTILTLSSHEPFDVPMKPHLSGDSPEIKFLNSCHYTDAAIGEFIQQCKTKPWWKNTVVIITADHGHRHPGNLELKDRNRYHIPLLWVGGAVRRDTVIHTIGGQTDIANTLLAQLDKPSGDFRFSKNLLGRHVPNFAVYIFNNGYGYLDTTRYTVYDNTGAMYLVRERADRDDDLFYGKAYIQTLYSDYNAKN